MALSPSAIRRLPQSLLKLNHILLDTTVLMQALQAGESGSPGQCDALEVQINALSQLFADNTISSVAAGERWISNKVPVDASTADQIQSAQKACVISLCTFLPAAMAALIRLEAGLSKSDERIIHFNSRTASLFATVWVLLNNLSDWTGYWPQIVNTPDSLVLQIASVYPALHDFLLWLLNMTRQGGAGQEVLNAYVEKGHVWQAYIYMFIEKAILFPLNIICGVVPAVGCSAVNNLPPGFLATLCCLACEADPRLKGPASGAEHLHCPDISLYQYTHIICLLETVLSHFHQYTPLMSASGPSCLNPELFCASAVEVVKQAVLFHTSNTPATHEPFIIAQHTLIALLHHDHCSQLHPVPGSSSTGNTSSGNSSISQLTPRFPVADQTLILALQKGCLRFPESLSGNTLLMHMTAGEWKSLTSESVVVSFGIILRHCSHHLCRSIQQQQCSKLKVRKPLSMQNMQIKNVSAKDVTQLNILMLSMLEHCDSLSNMSAVKEALHTLSGNQSQLSQEGPQKVQRSSLLESEIAFQQLPGSGVFAELVLRGICSNPSTNPSLGLHAIVMTLMNLAVQVRISPSFSSCCTDISMLASVHKALLLHATPVSTTHPKGITPASQQRLALKLFLQIQVPLKAVLKEMINQAQADHTSSEFQSTQSKAATAHRDAGSGSGVGSSSSCNISRVGLLPEFVVPKWYQLSAALVMVLCWSNNMRLRLLEDGHGAAWASVCAGDGRWMASVTELNPSLGVLTENLSLPDEPKDWETREAAFKQEAMAWDGYALSHFHGRLLPGCSYLGCTNMSGSSEQSMSTLLCSGCRRMRYCSVDCQKAAWLKGGHSRVC